MTTNELIREKPARHVSVDILKTVGILGVVAIHAFTLREKEPWAATVMAYFRFGVPIFIIVSFLLACERLATRGEDLAVFVKRMLRLLIPYAFYSVLYHFIWHHEKDWSVVQILKTNIGGFSWPGQYYLVVLVQLTLFYYLIHSLLLRVGLSIALLLSILSFVLLTVPLSYFHILTPVNRIDMSLFVYYLPALFWGCGLANSRPRIPMPSWLWPALFVATMLVPLLIVAEFRLAPFKPFMYSSLACVVAPLVMTYLLFGAEDSLRAGVPEFLKSFFNRISEYTLGIYCLNPIMIHVLHKYLIVSPPGELASLTTVLPEPLALVVLTLAAFLTSFFASFFIGNVPGCHYLVK